MHVPIGKIGEHAKHTAGTYICHTHELNQSIRSGGSYKIKIDIPLKYTRVVVWQLL